MRVRVNFYPTPGQVAVAMAIAARDALLDASTGPYEPDPPALTEYVERMTKEQSVKALRSCLWAYGDRSWPDDYSESAYRAALVKAERWFA